MTTFTQPLHSQPGDKYFRAIRTDSWYKGQSGSSRCYTGAQTVLQYSLWCKQTLLKKKKLQHLSLVWRPQLLVHHLPHSILVSMETGLIGWLAASINLWPITERGWESAAHCELQVQSQQNPKARTAKYNKTKNDLLESIKKRSVPRDRQISQRKITLLQGEVELLRYLSKSMRG